METTRDEMTSSREVCDAVVVGGGHNGIVAATLLADAGWDVELVEATDHLGGAVRSAEVTAPGFCNDLFSAFYPMTAASPVMAGLGLDAHGLRWSHAPAVLAHVRDDGTAAVVQRDVGTTAEGLERATPGDGAPWRELFARWDRVAAPLLDSLFSPFPPVRAMPQLAAAARLDAWDLVRMFVLPVRDLAAEHFHGDVAGLLLAGNALHADVTPESSPSALLGWMLTGLAQSVGYPVPVGGAGALIDALASRARAAGVRLHTATPATGIEVRGGRAVGVRTAEGHLRARRGVIAACDAQLLYGRLLVEDDLPASFTARMRQFHRASSTVKVDYALGTAIPWKDPAAGRAGTVHLADSLDELSLGGAQLASGHIPSHPFLLGGQMTTSDPSRSPEGTESFWIYTHVPQDIRGDAGGSIETAGRLRGGALEAFVDRMEDRVERVAPGFRDRVLARHVQGPDDLERANPSLVGGDISGGTAQLHQQLVFRPVPGLGRAETPVAGLYLGSSSAHPGGAVHGACGANAARAAMAHWRVRRVRLAVGDIATRWRP